MTPKFKAMMISAITRRKIISIAIKRNSICLIFLGLNIRKLKLRINNKVDNQSYEFPDKDQISKQLRSRSIEKHRSMFEDNHFI